MSAICVILTLQNIIKWCGARSLGPLQPYDVLGFAHKLT